jgi:hypothetical protein
MAVMTATLLSSSFLLAFNKWVKAATLFSIVSLFEIIVSASFSRFCDVLLLPCSLLMGAFGTLACDVVRPSQTHPLTTNKVVAKHHKTWRKKH